jgi:hypothetical protein
LQSGAFATALLITLEFASGTLRLNTSRYDLADPDSPAEVFIGVGLIGQIDPVNDIEKSIENIRITLGGADLSLISLAMNEHVRGRPIYLEQAILSAATHAVLDVSQIWAGRMSSMSIAQSGDNTATVVIISEHRGVLFSRPRPFRYTDTDQQRAYPGDRCLEYIVSQSQTQDIWPAASFFKK